MATLIASIAAVVILGVSVHYIYFIAYVGKGKHRAF